MKKEKIELQKRMNESTELFWNWFESSHSTPIKFKRLRTCQAMVFEFDDCYILQSYHTPVAGIRKDTGEESLTFSAWYTDTPLLQRSILQNSLPTMAAMANGMYGDNIWYDAITKQ